MNLILFLIIGAVAGWLAGNIMKGSGFGALGNIGVGIVGSFVGGLLFGLLGFESSNMLGSLISAVVGAMVFLWLIARIKKG